MSRTRVVMLSPVLPYDAVPHAGGGYVASLVRLLGDEVDLTLICPDTPVNRRARAEPGAPAVMLLGAQPGQGLSERAANRAVAVSDRWLRRIDPGAPHLPLARALLADPVARRAVEEADVVDLQWSECIRLAPLVRHLNPRARLVGTFHDVQSQLFDREPSDTRRGRLYWLAVAARSRRSEAAGVGRLDVVLAFSQKDLDLLGGPAHGRVVHPPLARAGIPNHRPSLDPTAVFVAHFARDENDKGAAWLLRTVWPQVVREVPDARLRLVGAGVSHALADLVSGARGVETTGFVPTLEPELAAARAFLVPLHQGAGVKFKTVEALLHGVPVVTTAVGAEGIVGPDLFAGLADDARGFADATVRVLGDPDGGQERADAARAWAETEYAADRFVAAVMDAWMSRSD